MEKIVQEVLAVIHPQGSPLIVARDLLIEWGIKPPVITDEYWLDIVEASNRVPGCGAQIPEQSSWGRWSFPLPSKEGDARRWGERLAWTAMQMNWVKTAEAVPISPLTPPQDVLRFIYDHPGLFETCMACPDLVAEYAPQLTIRGFGGELEAVIEREYKRSCAKRRKDRDENSKSGSALTTNGKCPLCDEEWALRHPTFGDYDSVNIAYEYFHGGMFGPHVSPFEDADHTFWLLSSASSWLPEPIRSVLVEGMRHCTNWRWGEIGVDHGGEWKTCGALGDALYDSLTKRTKFKWTDRTQDDTLNRIRLSISKLNLPEVPEELFDRFARLGFPECYITTERNSRRRRDSSASGKYRKKRKK